MKTRFKIGEISKLFRISIKTLRYYDEVGIFKPDYVNPENQYRYYSADQFEILTMITYMRHLEIPVKEIKKTLDNMTVDNIIKFLETHQLNLEEKIRELKLLKTKVEFRVESLKNGKNKIGGEEYAIEKLPQRRIIRLSRMFSRKEDLEIAVREFEMKLEKSNLFVLGKVGVILNTKRLLNKDFSEYDALYFQLDGSEYLDAGEDIEEGLYATLHFNGSIEESKNYYPKILDYIHRMGYEVTGPALEKAIISNSVTCLKKEYVRKIEISIKKFDPPLTGGFII